MVLMVLVMMVLCGNVQAGTNSRGEVYVDSAVAVVDGFAAKGLINLNRAKSAKYYIHPLLWAMLDFEQKEGLVKMCAHHYISTGGVYRCDLYDMKTGKEIAKISAFGLKLY